MSDIAIIGFVAAGFWGPLDDPGISDLVHNSV